MNVLKIFSALLNSIFLAAAGVSLYLSLAAYIRLGKAVDADPDQITFQVSFPWFEIVWMMV